MSIRLSEAVALRPRASVSPSGDTLMLYEAGVRPYRPVSRDRPHVVTGDGTERAAQAPRARDVPCDHGAVEAGGVGGLAVRRERDAVDASGVALERRSRSALRHVPDDHVRVVVAGDERAAVGAEGGALDGRVLPPGERPGSAAAQVRRGCSEPSSRASAATRPSRLTAEAAGEPRAGRRRSGRERATRSRTTGRAPSSLDRHQLPPAVGERHQEAPRRRAATGRGRPSGGRCGRPSARSSPRSSRSCFSFERRVAGRQDARVG